MLITVENIGKKREGQVYIKDYALYLLSNGTEGLDVLEPISNYDYITYEVQEINNKYKISFEKYLKPILERLARKIEVFLTDFPDFLMNKNKYYTKFKIPKKKPDEHGNTRWRHLINPAPELKTLQKEISDTLINCGVLAHNAAHAFRKNRDYYTNAEAHKNNKHIINLDLKDFFDSITEEILYENLKLHPLFNIPLIIDGQEYPLLENIVKICTFEGSTPQGSPASPFLSNIIMTNFDFRLRKLLNNEPIKCIYTRYADDMSFSSKKSQDISHIIHLVEQILKDYYHNTIKINYEKTKKITPGRCFITGVKLNQMHELTIGWEKKKEIKSRIYRYDETSPEALEEAQQILGYLSFMDRVEHGYTQYIINKYNSQITKMKNQISYN